jgi:hypothetical protein
MSTKADAIARAERVAALLPGVAVDAVINGVGLLAERGLPIPPNTSRDTAWLVLYHDEFGIHLVGQHNSDRAIGNAVYTALVGRRPIVRTLVQYTGRRGGLTHAATSR